MINEVFNEDCLIGMQRIPDKSIDMILCDLPYGTTACKWDVIIPFAPLWEQYERIIKDNGAIVLTASQPFTSALVMSNLKMFKYEWIWKKHQGTGHLNAKRQPLKIHESVLVFCGRTENYFPQMSEGSPYKKRGSHNMSIPNGAYNNGNPLRTGYSVDYDSSKRYPLTVVEFSNHNQKDEKFHPTQKPVALFEYLIKTYTNEGETVLDNCMGSGTTAIACINTGRNYIGFEKEEKYFQIIQDRIKNHTPQIKLAI